MSKPFEDPEDKPRGFFDELLGDNDNDASDVET